MEAELTSMFVERNIRNGKLFLERMLGIKNDNSHPAKRATKYEDDRKIIPQVFRKVVIFKLALRPCSLEVFLDSYTIEDPVSFHKLSLF